MKNASKQILRRIGLYGRARAIYRMLSPDVRKVFDNEVKLYGRFVSSGDLVFDIGVNLGQKSEVFLAMGCNVVAVEPNPKCHPVIESGCGKSNGFTLVKAAVGAETGTATLNFRETSAAASLRPNWHALTYGDGELETAVVDVTTLDQLIQTHGVPALCKIDVEGFEAQVVSGLTQSIPLITLEFHKNELAETMKCLEILSRLGPIKMNAVPMDSDVFLFDNWVAIGEIETALSAEHIPHGGDVFVASDSVI